MRDPEDMIEIEIALLHAAGRRYGLLLERARQEKRERIQKEARGAIEHARSEYRAGRPGRGGQGQGDLLRRTGVQHNGPGTEGDR